MVLIFCAQTLALLIFFSIFKNKRFFGQNVFILKSAGIPVKKRKTRKSVYVATLARSFYSLSMENNDIKGELMKNQLKTQLRNSI